MQAAAVSLVLHSSPCQFSVCNPLYHKILHASHTHNLPDLTWSPTPTCFYLARSYWQPSDLPFTAYSSSREAAAVSALLYPDNSRRLPGPMGQPVSTAAGQPPHQPAYDAGKQFKVVMPTAPLGA